MDKYQLKNFVYQVFEMFHIVKLVVTFKADKALCYAKYQILGLEPNL